MSIEELFKSVIVALEANTKAVVALEASLQGRTPSKSAEKHAKEEEKKPEDANAKQAAEMAEHAAELQATADKKSVEGNQPEAGISASVPYETVRALVLKLAPTQREAIKALNAKHGIANLKVLLDKEDDFSTVNDQAKLEAVYADLQELEG